MNKISILITDDHTLVRETWAFVLNTHPNFNVIAECSTAEESIEMAKKLKPNVVLMDINMPGMNGIEATQQIRKYSPGSRIVCISQHTQSAYFRKIMRVGALGYVTKNSPKEEMYKAIEEVNKGNKYVCSEIKSLLANRFVNQEAKGLTIADLSERELEVAGYIRKGYTSKEIAAVLFVAVKTIEVHRHNILKKLNIKNAASLVNLIINACPE